jgi:HEAT repeat protein
VANWLRDPDEGGARCAARLLLNRRRPEWRERAARGIPKSPHMSVRRLAAFVKPARETESGKEGLQPPTSAPSPQGFEKVWSDYQQMPPAVQHTAARQVAGEAASAEQLKLKLQGSPQEISQALRMIAALPSLTPYRAAIITLCGHSDPRIAAMAVRLIARLEDPRLRELLEAAAHHSDGRVRANAVESMESLHIVNRSQQVLAMLNSRHSRERANAIKALGQFNFGTARECLGRMLTDSNPLHRISALWVVEQLNLLEVMRQVSSMARRDANMRVRRRAAEMLETLNGNIAGPV